MLNMQYKSFVWPNNPKTYTLSCERRTVVQKIPMGGFEVQDLGATCMVLRGEGEFLGRTPCGISAFWCRPSGRMARVRCSIRHGRARRRFYAAPADAGAA